MNLLKVLTVAGTDHDGVIEALEREEFTDFEDCLQVECAMGVKADYIVTRNIADFKYSRVAAVEPEIFMKVLQDAEPFD